VPDTSVKPARRPLFAVALGAGGARGLAHVGVLKVLEQNSLRPDLVVGTSVGALIGAFYCAGLPIRDIEEIGRNARWRDFGSFSWRLSGVSSNARMEKWLASLMPTRRFTDLKIPLAVCATNLTTGGTVLFLQGDLFRAVRASCALPGIYEPVKVDGTLCADGGMAAYVPAPQARELGADVVLASDVRSPLALPREPRTIYQVLVQAFSIVSWQASERQLEAADVVVAPRMKDIGWEDLGRAAEIMVAGEFAMKAKVEELKAKMRPGLWTKLKGVVGKDS
jgi:NTE family protein